MALAKRVHPETKLRERFGFVTMQKAPDCGAEKLKQANSNMYNYDLKTKKQVLKPSTWTNPVPYVHREEKEIEVGMKDFITRPKLDKLDNPKALSVF